MLLPRKKRTRKYWDTRKGVENGRGEATRKRMGQWENSNEICDKDGHFLDIYLGKFKFLGSMQTVKHYSNFYFNLFWGKTCPIWNFFEEKCVAQGQRANMNMFVVNIDNVQICMFLAIPHQWEPTNIRRPLAQSNCTESMFLLV